MSEVIRVRDQFYILATSPLADSQTRVLKQGETFAIFDLYGDVRRLGSGEQGIYHQGTRYLSRSILRLGDERPLVLGSSVTDDNVVFAIDLTNPDMTIGETFVPRGTLHLFRSIFLWNGVCYQRFRLFSYAQTDLDVELSLAIESDFSDIFEVRGVVRGQRGTLSDPRTEDGALVIGYQGLDGIERRARVQASDEAAIDDSQIDFVVKLLPHTPRELFVSMVCEVDTERPTIEPYATAIVKQRRSQKQMSEAQATVRTSNEVFNALLDRSYADLRMMTTETEHGPFPYAGVPWFSAPFGRDAIITAFELLWVDPKLARGALAYLAATQAKEVDLEREAEPGKIVHEQRNGEMARLGEVPFGNYYGSVDSTPLFVALAGEYHKVTGDLEFIRSIWTNIEAALEWIDTYGDADRDGFVEYRGSARGLVQQGWKDSHDSVFHANGEIALPPIALCEVQGYVYWAKRRGAQLAAALGYADRAEVLDKQASTLREAFEESFWSDELGTYALALDGNKQQCKVRASNAGHVLIHKIASDEHARSVDTVLRSDAFFSGWGIRTLASTETRYGPITYHNGSIWPHDNAMVAFGLSRYGHKEAARSVLGALLDASSTLEFHRLPELYCGFPRRPGQGPIEYPLACAPQSWAAGSVFLLLRACLGLTIDAAKRQISLIRPVLPAFMDQVEIRGLRAGDASIDLVLHQHEEDIAVHVTNRVGEVEVVVVK